MVIFDTNILIELYRGNADVRQKVEQIESDIYYLSSISIAEFIVGAKNKTDLERIEKQLEKYTELPVNNDITGIFLELFRAYTLSHRPEIADTLIAATSIYYDLPLY